MSEKEPHENELHNEFLKIGKNIKGLVESFFSSEELKNFSQEMRSEFFEIIDTFENAANEFKESETGKKIQEDIHDLNERIENGEFQAKMKSEISHLLQILNEELEKGKENFKSKDEG